MSERFAIGRVERLIAEVETLRDEVCGVEAKLGDEVARVRASRRASARNLTHYLGLRQHDLRTLQEDLTRLGLSSLGRCEAHVLATLDAVLEALYRLADRKPEPIRLVRAPVDFHQGAARLARNTRAVLGPSPAALVTRVMVTLPTAAAEDPHMIPNLLEAGMDVMRINCAHDGPEVWSQMIASLRRAEVEQERHCRVQFDLSGPKVRTGPIDRACAQLSRKGPYLMVRPGDTLIVTSEQPGRDAIVGDDGVIQEPAQIGCTVPQVFATARPGQRMLFDDGKVGGVIRDVAPTRITMEVTHARAGAAKLRADKGINLPDTDLHLPALTTKDRRDLEYVVDHADIVAMSFVRRPEDVQTIDELLTARGCPDAALVLKIETRAAFENLPRLLLAAMRTRPVGVMVARGDLGVEIGFERLAEVQEEILWLCEAAHVPVIWATEVLDRMAKKSTPSRAEVTDAAMSGRAECVMLNKGPHIVAAMSFLRDVLQRMHYHQDKKRAMLRQLNVSALT